jgi:hypothetical protein
MDTSSWIQHNPSVQIAHTVKKFYGQYLYKMVVVAHGGSSIRSKMDIANDIQHRKFVQNSGHTIVRWFGYTRAAKAKLDEADIPFLEMIKLVKADKARGFKIRIEEPEIQIYAASEDQLLNLVANEFTVEQRQYIRIIVGPENQAAATLLGSGAILRSTSNGYKYKVIVRDGRYDEETKQNIRAFFTNIGPDEVMVTEAGLHALNAPGNYMWNLYFFCNDPSIVDFLQLISPGCVSNIHELVVLHDK